MHLIRSRENSSVHTFRSPAGGKLHEKTSRSATIRKGAYRRSVRGGNLWQSDFYSGRQRCFRVPAQEFPRRFQRFRYTAHGYYINIQF